MIPDNKTRPFVPASKEDFEALVYEINELKALIEQLRSTMRVNGMPIYFGQGGGPL